MIPEGVELRPSSALRTALALGAVVLAAHAFPLKRHPWRAALAALLLLDPARRLVTLGRLPWEADPAPLPRLEGRETEA